MDSEATVNDNHSDPNNVVIGLSYCDMVPIERDQRHRAVWTPTGWWHASRTSLVEGLISRWKLYLDRFAELQQNFV